MKFPTSNFRLPIARFIIYILLLLIIFLGFYFRLEGIIDNHSFWHDEAFVSALGRDIASGTKSLQNSVNLLEYQPLHLIIISLSLKLFGYNEFAARLPTVLFGTIGIIGAYLLARELSNVYGGIIAAFVFSFSQLNLANSTQAKPYTAIQTLFLFILYLIVLLDKKRENKFHLHIYIIILASLSSLMHYIGVLIWIPYFVYLLLKVKRKNFTRYLFNNPILTLFFSISLLILFFILQGPKIFSIFFSDTKLFSHNNLTYFRELFWKHYAFITLPGFLAILLLLIKRKAVGVPLTILMLFYSYLWIFRHANHSIRYVVPFFGILFVLFGTFWGEVIEKNFKKITLLVLILILMVLYAGGNKIVRKPSFYYSPNLDFFADIQFADYKKAFELIKKNSYELSSTAFFNNWVEAQSWYLSNKPIDAFFMKGFYARTPIKHHISGAIIYGSIDQFLKEKDKYKKGILFVEDWESILPEDIKQYAKKNMKLEFRIEGLPQAGNDKWPIEVYSWGITN